MKILLVSQYFPPESGATQNRMAAFAQELVERGHAVWVLCEQPNHPSGRFQAGFGRRLWHYHVEDGQKIYRVWVAASPQKTAIRRLLFYGTFGVGVGIASALLPKPDVVLATSPPLPGALVACGMARVRGVPYVADIRDLWPAAAEALGELSEGPLMTAAERAEAWLYRNAAAVVATTRPFCRHIARMSPETPVFHLPNGALDSILARPVSAEPDPSPFVVGYVGNLGIAQGLSILLEAASELRTEDVRFLVVGGGPLAGHLRTEIDRRGLRDLIELRGEIGVDEVPAILDGCHALLVPLGAHAALADFVPSKLFDAMAAGRPVLLAADGESRAIVTEHGCGVLVEPEHGLQLARAIRTLRNDPPRRRRLGRAGRIAAQEMARSKQAARLDSILTQAMLGRNPAAEGSVGQDRLGARPWV
jgi:glycosyltransferase involved in cell wall biosynthesis